MLWEIYDKGIPWSGLMPAQIISKVIVKHARPPVPKGMPANLRTLMCYCWAQNPTSSPPSPRSSRRSRCRRRAGRARVRSPGRRARWPGRDAVVGARRARSGRRPRQAPRRLLRRARPRPTRRRRRRLVRRSANGSSTSRSCLLMVWLLFRHLLPGPKTEQRDPARAERSEHCEPNLVGTRRTRRRRQARERRVRATRPSN